MKKAKKKNQLHKLARFSGIAFQMAATLFIGTYIGMKLDEKYPNEYHAFTAICSLLFISGYLFITIRRITKNSNNDE
jgi:uncharacterized membrane protein YfcA